VRLSALKKGRRYRYYVSAALISSAGTECARGWRLAATEIETAVIQILTDALTTPAALIERLGITGMPGEQVQKMLGRAARHAASLKRSSAEQAEIVGRLIDKIIMAENMITIRLRRDALIAGKVLPSTSDSANDPISVRIDDKGGVVIGVVHRP
jgi:site-specific DNA recombinase